MLLVLIALCEIGFWVLLLAGLTARYVLRRERLSAALLVATPAVDVVLLAASILDIQRGATPGPLHVLAAIYLGVSLGFGRYLIEWADMRFAHRFAGGPPPVKRPKHGPGRAAHERTMWCRHLLAYVAGTGLMTLAIMLIGDGARSEPFSQGRELWTLLLALDFAISFSYTFWPKNPKEPEAHEVTIGSS